MNVRFEVKFAKDLKQVSDGRLLKAVKELVLACKKVESLTEISQVKKLKGYDSFYRVRLGDYRIGLKLAKDGLIFVRCLHRKEIYRYFP
jgi:mRNA interferase RelE/StbE